MLLHRIFVHLTFFSGTTFFRQWKCFFCGPNQKQNSVPKEIKTFQKFQNFTAKSICFFRIRLKKTLRTTYFQKPPKCLDLYDFSIFKIFRTFKTFSTFKAFTPNLLDSEVRFSKFLLYHLETWSNNIICFTLCCSARQINGTYHNISLFDTVFWLGVIWFFPKMFLFTLLHFVHCNWFLCI